MVGRYNSQRLVAEGHWEWKLNYYKFCHITVGNANMPTLLQYDNSNGHKSLLAKLQYTFTRTFCDLQVPSYGR